MNSCYFASSLETPPDSAILGNGEGDQGGQWDLLQQVVGEQLEEGVEFDVQAFHVFFRILL